MCSVERSYSRQNYRNEVEANDSNYAKACLIGPMIAGTLVVANAYKGDVCNAVSSSFLSLTTALEKVGGAAVTASLDAIKAEPLAIAVGTMATAAVLYKSATTEKNQSKSFYQKAADASLIVGLSALTSTAMIAVGLAHKDKITLANAEYVLRPAAEATVEVIKTAGKIGGLAIAGAIRGAIAFPIPTAYITLITSVGLCALSTK